MAEVIGVTDSQARKYERGISRITASRLHDVAQALGVDVGYFFAGGHAGGRAFMVTPQQRRLLELSRNFLAIADRNRQKDVCALVRSLAENDQQGEFAAGLKRLTRGPSKVRKTEYQSIPIQPPMIAAAMKFVTG